MLKNGATTAKGTASTSPGLCGTAKSPELDPEALSQINYPGAQALGVDGAGVTVAFLAGSIDTTNPDFLRNATFAQEGHSGHHQPEGLLR